jgi:hypothetical protein
MRNWWRIRLGNQDKDVDDKDQAVRSTRVTQWISYYEGGLAILLHPQAQAGYQVPEETQRGARAAFPCGDVYMRVADLLGSLYHN